VNSAAQNKYKVVIGLEVHAQLLTKSKIFNADVAEYGSAPNTNVGVITLAHPGTLPKLNKKAVEFATKMGLACHSKISTFQIFDRKNYFYPDLPKGYQLTQDRTPICVGGFITIPTKDGGEKDIVLNRIHLEEDAGKSIHLEGETDTLLDFNRAGTPLIEIVTEPVISSSEDAGALMAEIRKLVRYLDICDGNMEEGSLRCDANVSMMLKDAATLGKKVEVKNMNSIRNIQRAIDFEMERQAALLEKGEPVISETRTFNANDGKTYSMRTKEELNDYRYFPDPDVSPLEISEKWLAEIKSSMPQLPRDLYQKFVTDYQLPTYDAHILTDTKETAAYFEEICSHTKNFKAASNWVMGPVKSYLNETNQEIADFPVSAKTLAEVIQLIDSGKLNFAVASQKLFPVLIKNPAKAVIVLAEELNLIQDSNVDSILSVVKEVINEFPLKVEEYKKGKKTIVTMFMGEVMKRSKGKADPKVATELIVKELGK
jgi:aspartyl-tRNA(Asn)/glutamyl-tRNA(Gln) amidotransferase subunit B